MDAKQQHGTGNSMMMMKTGTGWSRGLDTAVRGELKEWFQTRTWWSQVLIWAASINLIFLIVSLSVRQNPGELNSPTESLMIFNIFMGLVGPIGVSIVMQSAVVGEKKSGTAAWVLSKPISRVAFILSKMIGNGLGVAATMVLAQGIIAYLIAYFVVGITPPPLGFIAGMGVHLVHIFFYLTLTLMLGAIFEKAAPVIGIPIAFLFSQNFLSSAFPKLIRLMPQSLAMPGNNSSELPLAMALMTDSPVATYLPLIGTFIASVIFVGIALWVFQRQEL